MGYNNGYDDGYDDGFKAGVKKAGETGGGQQTAPAPMPLPEPEHIHVMYDSEDGMVNGSMVKVFAPDGVTEVELTVVGGDSLNNTLYVVNQTFAPSQAVDGVATFRTDNYDNMPWVQGGTVFVRYSYGSDRGPVVSIPGSEVVYEG